MGKLTATMVAAQVRRGDVKAYADGGNLYLRVTAPGSGKWVLRYMRAGRAREMGLGRYDGQGAVGLTLAEARDAAQDARRKLLKGIDPIDHRREGTAAARASAAKALTFQQVAEKALAAQEMAWRNDKHRAQWWSTLRTFAFPFLGNVSIAEVGTEQVLSVLQPIWTRIPETASRLRGRIEAVLAYASARGWREGDNPARWRGHLDRLLPSRSKIAKVSHHAALPHAELPAFVTKLRAHEATAARALELTILTATRTSEVLRARWSEFDLEASCWTIPADRMKAEKEHRVPLSQQATEILRGMLLVRQDCNDTYVFPGQRRGQPLSQMSMLMLLRRMKRTDLTVHGFRSTFRDWVEEETATPHAVAEAALAHAVGNKVEAAYRRGDLFAKRALLMQQWADFCLSG